MGRVAREINWINILTDNEHEKAQDAIQGLSLAVVQDKSKQLWD